jgi:hypothetical protein
MSQPNNTGGGEPATRSREPTSDLWTVIRREQWDSTRFFETMSRYSDDDPDWGRIKRQLTNCKSKHKLDSDVEAFIRYMKGSVKRRSRRKDAGRPRARPVRPKVVAPGTTDLEAASPANEEPHSPILSRLVASSPVTTLYADTHSSPSADPHLDGDRVHHTWAVSPPHQMRRITVEDEQSSPRPLEVQVKMLTEELHQSKAREAEKDIEVNTLREVVSQLRSTVDDREMKNAELEQTNAKRRRFLKDFYQQKTQLRTKLTSMSQELSKIIKSCADTAVVRQLTEVMELINDDHPAMSVDQGDGHDPEISGVGGDDDDDYDLESSGVDEDQDDGDGSELSRTVDDD